VRLRQFATFALINSFLLCLVRKRKQKPASKRPVQRALPMAPMCQVMPSDAANALICVRRLPAHFARANAACPTHAQQPSRRKQNSKTAFLRDYLDRRHDGRLLKVVTQLLQRQRMHFTIANVDLTDRQQRSLKRKYIYIYNNFIRQSILSVCIRHRPLAAQAYGFARKTIRSVSKN
jgi:hypothetical protein